MAAAKALLEALTEERRCLLHDAISAPRMTKRSRPVTGERTLDHVLVLGCTRAAWSYHVACVMLPQGCGARGGWIFQDVQIADRRGPVTPGEACERP